MAADARIDAPLMLPDPHFKKRPAAQRPGSTFWLRHICYNMSMAMLSALDQLLNPDTGWLTPGSARRLIDWKPSNELRQRIEALGQKANLGTLSAEEDAEYRAYLDDAETISLMQAKARRLYGATS
jgi:hypothetical protein